VGVLSSLGLFFVVRFVGSRFGERSRWRLFFVWLVLVLVFLVLVNSTVNYLSNINIG
jgi:hypothetical protein